MVKKVLLCVCRLQLLKTLPVLQSHLDALLEFDVSVDFFLLVLKMNQSQSPCLFGWIIIPILFYWEYLDRLWNLQCLIDSR